MRVMKLSGRGEGLTKDAIESDHLGGPDRGEKGAKRNPARGKIV